MNKTLTEQFPPLSRQEALVEANRCLYCYDAPCTQACPTHIDIPRFIKKISTDNMLGSVSTFNLDDLDNVSISGNLFDCQTGQPLEGVEVQLLDEGGEVTKITTSNGSGVFRFLTIPLYQNYKVVVRGKTISMLDHHDVCVKNLKADGSKHAIASTKFESIYFNFGKVELRPEAERTLLDLALLCKDNPALQIEIDGFTDEVGSDSYNDKLSLQRGKTTFEYLIA